jgi:hypothetical protein
VALTEAVWRELGEDYRARSLGRVEMKGKGPVEVVECAPPRSAASRQISDPSA